MYSCLHLKQLTPGSNNETFPDFSVKKKRYATELSFIYLIT